MHEDQQLCLLEGCPEGIEGAIVETGAETGGAENDAFDMCEGREAGDLGDDIGDGR